MTVEAFYLPDSLPAAIDLLEQHGADLVVMGGGTLVMPAVNEGHLFPRWAMSLQKAGLDQIRRLDGAFEIGAAVTAAQLAELTELPPLHQAAAELGASAVRTMATVGGNLFAHAPYGDLGVALLALDAEVELTGPRGCRSVALDDFFAKQDGAARQPDELVTALRVRPPTGPTAYLRMGRRQANTPSVAAVAICLAMDENGTCSGARIALGAAGPHPKRAHQAESALTGHRLAEQTIAAAAEAAMAESEPPTDALATSWYRRLMVGVAVRRALTGLATGPLPA